MDGRKGGELFVTIIQYVWITVEKAMTAFNRYDANAVLFFLLLLLENPLFDRYIY